MIQHSLKVLLITVQLLGRRWWCWNRHSLSASASSAVAVAYENSATSSSNSDPESVSMSGSGWKFLSPPTAYRILYVVSCKEWSWHTIHFDAFFLHSMKSFFGPYWRRRSLSVTLLSSSTFFLAASRCSLSLVMLKEPWTTLVSHAALRVAWDFLRLR